MRNTYLKEIRHEFKDSRFFFGKNRVMAKALGTTPEEEYKEGLSAIAKVSFFFKKKRERKSKF
jgi:mRNA turnover protein 4